MAALKKLEYLLRERPFTLKTDHKNLTYLQSDSCSPKVRRWKLWMLGFDTKIEFVKGRDNGAADGLSRILDITEEKLCAAGVEKAIPPQHKSQISACHGGQI